MGHVTVAAMKTALRSRIKDEDFQAMERYACDRIETLESAMLNWRAERKIYEAQMEDKFDWRKGARVDLKDDAATVPDDIFDRQNDSLNISASFAEATAARCRDDIFGSSPYYAMEPEGKNDRKFATKLQKHSEWKLRQGTFEQGATESIPLATGLGEAILKVRWREDIDTYEAKRGVMVDEQGEPILTSNGDFIYDDDEIRTDSPTPQTPGPNGKSGMNKPVARTYPAKDPSIDLTGKKTSFKQKLVETDIVRFRNVDAYNVHYLSFIAPLNVPTLEDAIDVALVGQTFDMSLLDMKAMLKGNIDKDVLDELTAGSSEPKTDGETKPREGSNEVMESRADEQGIKNPVIRWCEVYFSYYLENGKKVRVFGIVARDAKKLVYCEYLALITPRGMCPFFVIPCFKIQGRWYGRGYFEMFAKAQAFIDRHLNYVAYANRSNRIALKGIQRDALDLVDEDGEWEPDPDEWLPLKPGKTIKDAFQIAELPQLEGITMELLKLMLQTSQARSGVSGPAHAAVSQLPQNGTATGIDALVSAGSMLAKVPLTNISKGVEKALYFAMLTLYDHFDAAEDFAYEEGDTTLISRITPDEVNHLELHVRLILSRFRQREQRENAKNAVAAVIQYITEVPDHYKSAVRPFYVQIVNGCGFDEAESAVPEPVPAPAAPVDKVRESMSYKDAPDDVKRQIEQRAGYKPSQMEDGKAPRVGPDGNPLAPEQVASGAL